MNKTKENNKRNYNYEYDIGDKIGKLTIIEKTRKRYGKNNRSFKAYKYHCDNCGNEDIIIESNLKKGISCNVCCSHGNRKVKVGVNSILDTHPHLIDLGVSVEDAKKYSAHTHQKINVMCPICNTIVRNKNIAVITRDLSIGCPNCSDGKSYGEKFIFNLLQELKEEFQTEVSFEWCEFYNEIKKRKQRGIYDFVLKNKKLIIEIDGGFHRRDNNMNGISKKEALLIDSKKDSLALKNGYDIVRIEYKDDKYLIDETMLKSKLKPYLDLENIDFKKIKMKSMKSLVVLICNIWSEHKGELSANKIASMTKIDRSTVIKYLKKGNEIDLCKPIYDSKLEIIKSGKMTSKTVKVEKDDKLIGIYKNHDEMHKFFLDNFKVELKREFVRRVCLGYRKTYKGFTFKYVKNEGEDFKYE